MADLLNGASAVISDCGRYRYRLERDGPGMTDKARELVERLRNDEVRQTVADGPDPLTLEAADFIEQSLAPPEGDTVSEGVVLPCDVSLPPATTIAKGCKLSTLLHALELRGMATYLQSRAHLKKNATTTRWSAMATDL